MTDGLEAFSIELRDTFLTIATHDLKTPLTSIQVYAQLLSLQLNQGFGRGAAPSRKSAHLSKTARGISPTAFPIRVAVQAAADADWRAAARRRNSRGGTH